MSNIFIIAKRIVVELKSDKRTIALLIVAPIFLMTIVNILFNASYQDVELGYVNNSETEVVFSDSIIVSNYDNMDEALDDLSDKEISAVLVSSDEPVDLTDTDMINISDEQKEFLNTNMINFDLTSANYNLYLTGEEPIYDSYIQSEVADSIMGDNEVIEVENTEYNYELLDELEVLMLEFIIVFFSFLTVGISFLRERQNFTLERTLTSNMKRYQLVLGYLTGYGFIAIFQSIIIELYMVYVLDMPIYGSLIVSIIINVLVALVGISLGTTLSAFAKNEFQIMQFIPIVIIPQIIFSGILPYSELYQIISKFSPITYATDMQVSILLQDQYDILPGILFMIVVIFIFNCITIRKLRKVRDI